jgi:riboflavin synthase
MFTGIIEHLGTIARLEITPAGGRLTVEAPVLGPQLAVSGSVAVNGCCLTVVERDGTRFSADLSPETLARTSFVAAKAGVRVNLEQPLAAGKEFGGHFVLGHVDGTGRVVRLDREGDGWRLGVEIPAALARAIVSKGSVAIDGISLTVARWHAGVAEAAIIPYTYEHTNLRDRVPGDPVNLEGDILGKYVERHLGARESAKHPGGLTLGELVRQGF